MHKKLSAASLLEILIALVLFSIALLGIAALQLTGIRFVHSANVRYQAMLQLVDMADRMRANITAVENGAYNRLSGTGSNPGCISTACSAAQMASTDQFQWNTANSQLLPNGSGTVERLNSTDFRIRITWSEMSSFSSNNATPSTQSIQLVFTP